MSFAVSPPDSRPIASAAGLHRTGIRRRLPLSWRVMNRSAAAPLRGALSLDESSPLWQTLDRLALILVAAVVIARALMLETLRDPDLVMPGQFAAPLGPGPVATLVLGLLSIIPAMIVLLRRAFDPTYRLTASLPSLLLIALGLLAGASVLWADDRFAAIVQAAQLVSGAVLLWAAAQLVRDWGRFRIGIAICAGLLAVFIIQGIGYRFIELPELQDRWQNDIDGFRTQALRERGWQPDDYAAQKFAQKVMAGEMIGNTASPNSLAATTVMLMVVMMGLLAHRFGRREHVPAALTAVLIAGAGWIIFYTYSNAACITPLLAVVALLIMRPAHRWMAEHHRLLFAVGCIAFVLGAVALVGHGLYHGSLPHVSLTFRWRYWLAAAAMVADHPLLGVGYGGFGNSYLTYRLPAAAEEIRDPHNLLMRFASELGLIGALLAVAWLAALWWRMTRPKAPDHAPAGGGAATMVTLILAIAGGIVINLIAAVDYSQSADYILLEVFKRILYALLLIVGAGIAVIVRDGSRMTVDQSPAPWLMRGAIVAIGLFLLHNMIDFSFFEAGPLHIFALLAGSVLGIRADPDVPVGRGSRGLWLGATAGVGVVWLVTAVTVVGPVLIAEDSARTGDRLLREGNARAAVQSYAAAFDKVPGNADYAYRAAVAMMHAQAPVDQILAMLGRAIESDPTTIQYRLMRARFVLQLNPPRYDDAIADFTEAVERNPHEISLRWEFAQLLARMNRPAEAIVQAKAALAVNDAYAPDESEKLSSEREAEIRAFIESLR